MRRRINPEPDLVETSAAETLQQTFALLLPIRRQRLNRSERVQREQEQALRAAGEQCAAARQQLDVCQQHYQQLRDAFATGMRSQEQLVQGLAHERQAGEAVNGQKRELTHCQQQQTQQEQRVLQAQQDTRACQRDVEKLEYLMRESEALR